MNRLPNVRLARRLGLPGLVVAVTAGVAVIATVDLAVAKSSGGNASHSMGNAPHSMHTLPERMGKSSHDGKHHSGKDYDRKKSKSGKYHKDKDHDRDRAHEGKGTIAKEGTRDCRKCGDKGSVVIIDGKTKYKVPDPSGVISAHAVPGGIAIQVDGRTFTIPGTTVTVKNGVMSQSLVDKGGLTQTVVRNRDGSVSAVLTVAKPPLKGL